MTFTTTKLRWLRVIFVAVIYYITARGSIALVAHDESVFSPVWIPSGIALAAVLRWGPTMAIAALIGEFLVSLQVGASIGVSFGLAIGNSIEPLIAAWLLHRMGVYWRITRVPDVFAFLVAAVAAAAVSATTALVTLGIFDGTSQSSISIWGVFALSVVLGVVLITPFLLAWLPLQIGPVSLARSVEALGLLMSLVVVSWVAFVVRPLDGALLLMLFPLLAWSVLRFQERGATGSVVVVGIVAAVAVFDHGLMLAELSSIHSAQALQGLLSTVTLTTLLLAALLEERDVAAAEARNLSERLAEAQEIAHVGSWDAALTPHGTFHWSRELCRLLNIDPRVEEESLATVLAHVHDDDRERLRQELSRASTTCTPFSIEHRVAGHDRIVHHTGRIIGIDTDACRIAAAAVDITEHKSIERIRDALIATASHELRTPLTSVIGFASTLHSRWNDLAEPQRRDMARIIHEQGIRLSGIVDDTLMQSRLDGKAIVVSPTRVSVAAVIDEARIALRDRIPPITVHCPPQLLCAANPEHLRRILVNLLTNAAKYGELPITVDASNRFGSVRIRVSDRGGGVTPEFEPRMFDRFARAYGTDAQPGTGLGLSIVYGLVEACGGSITYEHRDDRTSFTVTLPEWVESADRARSAADAASDAATT